MVAEIKIQSYSDEKKDFFVCNDFEKLIDRDIEKVLLYKESEDFITAYLFVDENLVDSFIGILLKHSITVCNKKDFTNEMINIVLSNKLQEFKSELHPDCDCKSVFDEFYKNYIDIDLILDKIYKHGIISLNENDNDILKKASSY